MARIAKSKDTANWRKGKDLQVGDAVFEGAYGPWGELVTVTEYLGKVPYMGTTNHQWLLSNGNKITAAGGEFICGQY